LKNYGDIDSKFRYIILAAMRAKQLLGGAKPRIKSKARNLIRVAQEEVKKGLVDYEIVKTPKEEIEEISDSDGDVFIGEDLTPDLEEELGEDSEEQPEEKLEEEEEEESEEEEEEEEPEEEADEEGEETEEEESAEEEKPKRKKKS
jgi:DNA-directed RNA polymerase subunit K/omega